MSVQSSSGHQRVCNRALDDCYDSDSDFSDSPPSTERVYSVDTALRQVSTRIDRSSRDVRVLRHALAQGDSETNRPALPEGVVAKILDMARYWCTVEKRCNVQFSGHDMNRLFFKFGPIPGKPKAMGFRVKSHDQGWSSYPECHGTKEGSWTWGEVDIKGSNGTSKLEQRVRIFSNIHAESKWRRQTKYLRQNQGFMNQLEKGDTLELYFRSMFPGWCIYVSYVEMTLFYTP